MGCALAQSPVNAYPIPKYTPVLSALPALTAARLIPNLLHAMYCAPKAYGSSVSNSDLAETCTNDINSHIWLKEADASLSTAEWYQKPLEFMAHLDPDYLKESCSNYDPTLDFSSEACGYGLVFGLGALALYAGAKKSVQNLISSKRD